MDETPVSLGCSKAFCRDDTLLEEHASGLYGSRPMLYSVRNTTRLTVESSRARSAVPAEPAVLGPLPTAQAPPVRDFTAYFQCSPDCDPSYAASHTVPELDRSRVIPAYPVGQSLRWHPYVETSSIEDISYSKKDSKTCRCTKCSSKNCTARASSSSTLKSGSGRISNITTFADIYTMTPQLKDTACGSSIFSPPRQAESATGSHVALRDSRGTQQRSTSKNKCNPTSILKCPRRRRICDYNDVYVDNSCEENDQQSEIQYVSGQDNSDNEPSQASSRYSFHSRRRNDEPKKAIKREMIYNEGISDQIRYLCDLPACEREREYSPSNTWRLRSCEYQPIPHAHCHNSSRYHRHCKESRSKVYVLDSEQCRLVPSSPRLPPHHARHPSPFDFPYAPCIKLPRKVLTSEADIEFFVDPQCQLARCATRNF